MLSCTSCALAVTFAFMVYFVLKFVAFYKGIRYREKYIRQLPGLPHHWLWGHARINPDPGESLFHLLQQVNIQFPRIRKVYYGPFEPCCGVPHPETAKLILKSSEPKPKRFGPYRVIRPWLGDGLLVSRGDKWNRNRRLLTPAFHFEILKPYMTTYNEAVDILLAKFEKCAEERTYFETFNQISKLTLDIILRCACSLNIGCQTEGENRYQKAVDEMGDMMFDRLVKPWLYADFIYSLTAAGRKFSKLCSYVHSVSEDVIQKRRQTLKATVSNENEKKRRLDFLDILLTAKDATGEGLTDQEIRDEVDTFMFEGYDTTASAISWVLYTLAKFPKYQKMCQEEIDSVLAGRDNDHLTWEDLPDLRFLAMCIKETIRLHTTVPYIFRELTKDMFIDGYFVPKGTIINICLYAIHHNPTVWEDDMSFKPERMSPENLEKMDPFSFVPFSAGPRNCIGQNFAMHEMKTVIARILRRFWLELDPNHTVEQRIVLVLKTSNGIMMKATPRDSEKIR